MRCDQRHRNLSWLCVSTSNLLQLQEQSRDEAENDLSEVQRMQLKQKACDDPRWTLEKLSIWILEQTG
jgi:hypothetical protein